MNEFWQMDSVSICMYCSTSAFTALIGQLASKKPLQQSKTQPNPW